MPKPTKPKIQKIKIPFSFCDLEELQEGKSFTWTFPDQNGVDIQVELYQEEEGE